MTNEFIAEEPSDCWDARHDLSITPVPSASVRDRESVRHLVFIADIPDRVLSQFESAMAPLVAFECLDVFPLSYLHITAKVVGTLGISVPADEEQRVVEIGHEVFDVDSEPGSITFPKLNLFPSVVYAEVEDNERFARINDRLCESGLPVYDRDRNGFIPHVALARFTQAENHEVVIDFLERNRGLSIDPVEITAIRLIALDPSEWYPSFETVETFALGK